MVNQILAIYFLSALDRFIKEKLKIRCLVRYQDDFLLFHPSKKYLQYCLTEIRKFLHKEKLTLNSKTRIYKNTNNFLFLGRNSKGKYAKYRNVKRKLKSRYYLYKFGKVPLDSLTSSLICYKSLCNKDNIIKFKSDTLNQYH